MPLKMFGGGAVDTLICAMFATRLSLAWCGMCTGALTVALPVVGFSAGVALPHGGFPGCREPRLLLVGALVGGASKGGDGQRFF